MNVRRIERDDSFYSNVTGHFSNRKGFGRSRTLNLDNNTFENLNTFFVSFFNFVMYTDDIARAEAKACSAILIKSIVFILKSLFIERSITTFVFYVRDYVRFKIVWQR